MQPHPNQDSEVKLSKSSGDRSTLRSLVGRLNEKMQRDTLIQKTTDELRDDLNVDRVVIYYFYRQWEGQVTYESFSDPERSIYGCTGPDECFNGEYAALYLGGRVRAIADIEVEPINDCHRDFLRSLGVRANLAVPILNPAELWGLLIAHHCQEVRSWSESDIDMMKKAAATLANSPTIRDS
ncbi:MAG: GAF domain-containing protein [Cyanobacteriota bacterium]|nr:GAF domain-containing protein [Cyanobacteriota bacterium]